VLDPEVFPEGKSFLPERFMETTDPRLLNHKFGCFGFGRRICPGMLVALQSLYIVIARLVDLSARLDPSWNKDVNLLMQHAMGV
jgi:cytochrome P450